jgi:hypothetical protein
MLIIYTWADQVAHILNTLKAVNSPLAHCFLYPSSVGFTESANLPMTGIVHRDPGRLPFLARYTVCSSTRRERRIAREVMMRVGLSLKSLLLNVSADEKI